MRRIFEDNSVTINFPDTIKIKEQKAPTDESIRLMEEMHDKALKNIIVKVKVEDNLVNGECWVIDQPWNINDIKLVFKFQINGHEFNLEKEVDRNEFMGSERDIARMSSKAGNFAKSLMLWYALKMFTTVMYEKITKEPFPKELH